LTIPNKKLLEHLLIITIGKTLFNLSKDHVLENTLIQMMLKEELFTLNFLLVALPL
jgi:hypothetical protein